MPSAANLSRFGVRPAMMPRLYAPTLNQPTSSDMITTMLGFLAWASTSVAPHARNKAHAAITPPIAFLAFAPKVISFSLEERNLRRLAAAPRHTVCFTSEGPGYWYF